MSVAALEAVLDELAVEAPAEVARGRAALGRALAWTSTTDWGEVAWSFSDLAGGSPLELVWRPGRSGLFWTAEPAPPEWPTARRVKRAVTLAGALGSRFRRSEICWFRNLMSSSHTPWPIWLGGRHDSAGDVAKLYARTAPIPLDGHLPGKAALLGRHDDQLVMLGLSPDGGRELYWRRTSPQPGDRWRMAHHPSLRPLVTRLDAALMDWTGQGLDGTRLGRIGLSLKLTPAGEPEALAAFMRVRQAGPDQAVREHLLASGGRSNPALARLWASGRLGPMFLTLAATAETVVPSIGLRLVDERAKIRSG